MAMMSSIERTSNRLQQLVMPPPSIWKTPSVSAPIVNFKRGAIIGGNLREVEIWSLLPDSTDSLFENGQRLQAEKIHLEHSKLREGIHLVLADDFVVLSAAQWDVFVKRPITDDHPRCVDARVPAQSFQDERVVPELASIGLVAEGRANFRVFSAAAERVMFNSLGIIFASLSASV